MKLVVILLTITLLHANASSFGQLITIRQEHISFEKMLKEIRKQTGYDVLLYDNKTDTKQIVTVDFNRTPLTKVLERILHGKNLDYTIDENTIIIRPKIELSNGSKGKELSILRIKGTVFEESGSPLPGVSVRSKETKLFTVTDSEGQFTMDVEIGETLSFSYVGYETKEIVVREKIDIVVKLTPVSNALKEIEVTYGKQRIKELTGSITQIDALGLQDMPVNQFAQQLQGKVAGVQISQSTGQPGRGMEFRIRGAASLYADTQPLFVVDGIPITGSINNINPSEIETFTILKDASASALYGSRAANGVILITTIHAKPGDAKVTFSSNYGVQKISEKRVPDMMNAQEFATYQNELFEDKVKYENFKGVLNPVYVDPERYGEGTDWFHTLTRSAPIQNYDLSVLSAGEKSSSAVIAGYSDQQGVIVNTGTKLFSLRVNQEQRLGNGKLKIGFNIAPSYRIDHNNRLGTDGLAGLFEKVVEGSPLIPAINPDGSYPLLVNSPGMVSNLNPYGQFMLIKDDYKTTRLLGNTYLNYEILKGLVFKTNLALDKGAETRNYYSPTTISTTGNASGISSSVGNYSWTGEANLQYHKTFNDDHNIEALIGYSAQRFEQESNSVTGANFPGDDVEWISAATSITAGTSNTNQYSMLSALSRINYNYKGKYLLSSAIRQDGSSRFGGNRKYGYFPSVSAGWVISDESFLQNVKAIDLLKFRVSYGVTGNNNIGNFTHISTIGASNYVVNGVLSSGTTVSSLGNDDLTWERNKQFDVGIDIGMFKNRVNVTYDYYHKISDGLIMARQIPRASGFSTINFNIGVFEFWGHEFTLNTTNLTVGDLKWTSNLNLSFDRNKIKSLVSPGFIRRNNTVDTDFYRNQEGRSLGAFYGFIFDGLYKDEADLANSAKYTGSNVGTIKMKDINGDGKIDDVNDRTFIGDPTPDFSFGFTNNFKYKKLDLSITMAGSVGGQILAASKWAFLTNLDGARNLLAVTKDRWRSPENPGSGIYPRTLTGSTAIGRSTNSQWIEDGSYLAAKNITLGYTIDLKSNLLLKQLRVYTSIQQAFIITSYTGINPEINLSGLDATKGIGIDANAYPVPRTFSIGISTTFK